MGSSKIASHAARSAGGALVLSALLVPGGCATGWERHTSADPSVPMQSDGGADARIADDAADGAIEDTGPKDAALVDVEPGDAAPGDATDGARPDSDREDAGDASLCTPTAEQCNGLDDDCDGEIDEGFDLQWDTANCGTCGNVCPEPEHTMASCSESICGRACAEGWGDCDPELANGCETSLATVTDCGACGASCTALGECQQVACDLNEGACLLSSSPDGSGCVGGGTCQGGECIPPETRYGFYGDGGWDTLAYPGGTLLATAFSVGTEMTTLIRVGLTARPPSAGIGFQMGVYADSGASLPGMLVAQTGADELVAGSQELDVVDPVTISAGQYWIAFAFSEDVTLAKAGGALHAYQFSFNFGDSLPSPFVQSGFGPPIALDLANIWIVTTP